MDWTSILVQVLQGVLVVLIPAIATAVIRFVLKKINETDHAILSHLTALAVQWANQKLEDASNDEKLEAVTNKIIELAKEHGIKVTEAQIDVLIESTVKSIKDTLSDQKN